MTPDSESMCQKSSEKYNLVSASIYLLIFQKLKIYLSILKVYKIPRKFKKSGAESKKKQNFESII